METKHRNMEDVLQDLGKKIDQMIENSQLSKIEWKKEVDQRVEEVKRNIETLETKTKEVLGDKERWKEVEDKLRKATDEFCDAVDTAFRNREDNSTGKQEEQ